MLPPSLCDVMIGVRNDDNEINVDELTAEDADAGETRDEEYASKMHSLNTMQVSTCPKSL